MNDYLVPKLEQYNKYANVIWGRYLNGFNISNDNHIFLRDMDRVHDSNVEDIVTYNVKSVINNHPITNKDNINKYFKQAKCKFIPKKVLPKKLVNELFSQLTGYADVPDWNKLQPLFDSFSDYLLYSNTDMNTITKMFAAKSAYVDNVNVLILGAGPTGLYIGNYLHNIFTSAMASTPIINLCIIDNKVPLNKEGYRMPYTRNRIFGLNIHLLSSFLPNFPCIQDLIKKGGINIRYLENIMITLIYGANIPIYFTTELNDETVLKKFISDNHIDIIFDCTGARFKNDFISNPTTDIFPPNTILENDKYQVVRIDNEYQLQRKNNIDYRFYLAMEIFDAKGKLQYNPFSSWYLEHTSDIKFFSKFHNICLKIKKNRSVDSALKIFDGLIDLKLAKDIQNVLVRDPDQHFKFFIIESFIRHKIQISSIIKQPNQTTIYIGAGDTIFSSHFVVGAGLNRLLPFIDRILWYIQTLSTI